MRNLVSIEKVLISHDYTKASKCGPWVDAARRHSIRQNDCVLLISSATQRRNIIIPLKVFYLQFIVQLARIGYQNTVVKYFDINV